MRIALLLLLILSLIACNQNNTTMTATIHIESKNYKIDLDKPIDISIPVQHQSGVGAWYIDQPTIKHVEVDGYVGKVELGGSTNFNDVSFNPHSHVTHTECVGHITKQVYSVNQALNRTFFKAQVISVQPEEFEDDLIITLEKFTHIADDVEAIVIRTLPNSGDKKTRNYSHTNPPYLLEEVAVRFRESGIKHLLIDLPSVDKEKDEGALLAHKAFFNYQGDYRMDATITEFIYVPDEVSDGNYLLDLQIAPIENDAAPSRPILYKIKS
ncbi:cyclase family protein [Nonlabens tegetincola]|uniref:cyclase family protein n=1 Tax=Nonlabens tegetincola TaxID=323273 RepID=UPI0026BBBC56|nr:cyclase family protein [Nonlabens tegetincola]